MRSTGLLKKSKVQIFYGPATFAQVSGIHDKMHFRLHVFFKVKVSEQIHAPFLVLEKFRMYVPFLPLDGTMSVCVYEEGLE